MIATCLIWTPTLAQDAAEQGARPQPPVDLPWVEWAIAPDGTTLPSGTVIQEGIFLPPGTVLPGGAVWPGAAAVTTEPTLGPTPDPGSAPMSRADLAPEPVTTLEPSPVAIPETTPEPGPSLRHQSPLEQVTQGVPHLSGGIGTSEREQMEQVKAQYNLRLLFAEAGSGAYLSHVRVTIQDATGPTLLSTVTIGPWFYANLAPGDYTLTVEYTGQAQTRQVRIPASGAAAESFYWSIP